MKIHFSLRRILKDVSRRHNSVNLVQKKAMPNQEIKNTIPIFWEWNYNRFIKT